MRPSLGYRLLLGSVWLIAGACANAESREQDAVEPWGKSEWAYLGPDGKLVYKTTPMGDRIMDFSHAGYMGGGVAIPAVPVRKTVAPSGTGDDTDAIQAAIDEVSAMPLVDGFRGAVSLAPGTFTTSRTLTITTSGVVLRGSGSEDGGTTIQMAGPRHRFLNIAGSGSYQLDADTIQIVDAYIPSGATWFTLRTEDAAKFRPGDAVLIRRPVTDAWLHLMGMDSLIGRDGNPQTWLAPGTIINADRTIASVNGYRITLDVPLSDSYDAKYLNPPGTTIVKYAFPGRIEQVGVESIRIVPVPDSGVEHSLLGLNAVSDAWVRDVVTEEMRDAMTISSTARRITLERMRFFHSESEPHQGGSSPAHIAISGSQVLIDRSSSVGKKLWPIVTQGQVTGPNVVLNFTTDEAGVSPHQRWATGLLVDGGQYRNNWEWRPGIALGNRAYAGSGHGWSAGWSVVWNVKSDYLLIEQPPGGANWAIGSTARYTTVLWDGTPLPVPPLPSDKVESVGVAVNPASLYLQQLRERLGEQALENIGYGSRGRRVR